MSNLVTFGKYKGQPVEALMADTNYVEWLMAQPSFTEGRHKNVYDMVTKRGVVDPKTPVHNAMQARFLDKELIYKFAAIRNNFFMDDIEPVKHLRPKWSVYHSNDDEKEFYYRHMCYPTKYPPCESEIVRCDFEDYNNYEASTYIGVSLVNNTKFEKDNWDVIIDCTLAHVFKRGRDGHAHGGPDIWSVKLPNVKIYIELKPSLGDDYPAVMRQINKRLTNGPVIEKDAWKLIVIDSFNGKGVTWEQVQEMISTCGCTLVYLPAIQGYVQRIFGKELPKLIEEEPS